MRLKSYFVHSIEEAIQQAKNELGGDAMLVDTKSLPAQPGNRARVEVIFAAPTTPPPPPPVTRRPSASRVLSPDSLTVERVRGGLTSLLAALSDPPGSARLAGTESPSPALEWLQSRLAAADLPTRLIGQFTACEGILPSPAESPAATIAAFLAARIPETPVTTAGPRRIALIGPAGGGKTTVAAKLAYRLGLEKGIAPLVISLDNIKIGATDQISRLCRLLGVAYQAIENPGDLQTVLEENEHRRLVLIDTPGLHNGDPDLADDLATCMTGRLPIERHLVLPAFARIATLEAWFGQAAVMSISHLLFTRLDETELYGPMWALAATLELPLSWISLGPRIPEDLEPARVSNLCTALAGIPAPQAPLRANAARAGSSHS